MAARTGGEGRGWQIGGPRRPGGRVSTLAQELAAAIPGFGRCPGDSDCQSMASPCAVILKKETNDKWDAMP